MEREHKGSKISKQRKRVNLYILDSRVLAIL